MKLTQKLKIMLRALILKAGEIETDKGRLIYDGDELTVGTEVFVEQANGEEIEVIPAPDGEYEADGKTYVVAEGKIAEIREPEEPAEEESEEMEDEPAAEPADEPEAPAEEGQTVEERIDVLEGRVAQILEGIEAILNAIAALEGRVDALEEKMAGLEEPAADPIDEKDENFSDQPKSRLQIYREMNK